MEAMKAAAIEIYAIVIMHNWVSSIRFPLWSFKIISLFDITQYPTPPNLTKSTDLTHSHLIVPQAQSIIPVTPKLWRPSRWCASCSMTLIQAFSSLRECEYIAKTFATLLRKQSSGRVAPTTQLDINSVDIWANTYSNGWTSSAVNGPLWWVSWWSRWIFRKKNFQWRTRWMV